MKTKTQISFALTWKLISAFVFAIRIVQSLSYLNPKFQASIHLLWLYSPVCIGPGQKPRRPFSHYKAQGASRSSLIWVCTVCPDQIVRKLRIITVTLKFKHIHCREMTQTKDADISLIWVHNFSHTYRSKA